jgi:hypothetical protein
MAEQSFQWPGRRINDPAHEMLVAFLVMDIQRNPEWARELADRIEQVKTGKLPVWERIGNAYRLELTGKGALIEDLVDEDGPAQEITLEEFSKAVEAWIKSFESED